MRLNASWFLAGLLSACASGGAPAAPNPPPTQPPRPPSDAESWRDTPPAPGPRRPFAYPVARQAKLDNGMTVLVVERDTPLLAATLVLKHGSTTDPPGKKGLMALTSRMLVEETRSKDSLALAEAAEALGGELEAKTGYDSTSVSLEFLRDDAAVGFGLLAEVVSSPRFAGKVFERVRDEWLDGLRAERQEPAQLAGIAGVRTVLGNELGAPTDGTLSGVAKLSTVDLAAAHRRLYTPSSAALVVVGGMGFDAVVERAKQAFAKWTARGAKPAEMPRASSSEHPRVLVVDRPDAVQSAIFVGLAFPPRPDEGFERRQLLNQVLGGMFTSRLNQNLREKNAYTYGAFSYSFATHEFGLWELNTSVRAEDTEPALREILSELEAIRGSKPISSEELERAKRELLGRYSAHLEQSADVNDDISELFVDGLKLDYLSRLASTLEPIGVADVQREASLRIKPDQATIVVVGDAKQLRASMRALLGDVSLAPAELFD